MKCIFGQDSSTKASVEITFTFTKAPISETISSPSIADDSAEKRTSSAAAPVHDSAAAPVHDSPSSRTFPSSASEGGDPHRPGEPVT